MREGPAQCPYCHETVKSTLHIGAHVRWKCKAKPENPPPPPPPLPPLPPPRPQAYPLQPLIDPRVVQLAYRTAIFNILTDKNWLPKDMRAFADEVDREAHRILGVG